MVLSELPYPLRLCTELVVFAASGANGMTDNVEASVIAFAIGVFCPPEMVEMSRRILTNEMTPDELKALAEPAKE